MFRSFFSSSLILVLFVTSILAAAGDLTALKIARDKQDLAGIDQAIAKMKQAGQNSADANYQLALAYSYGAEVAIEVKDKKKAQQLAEEGIAVAKKAMEQDAKSAEYHRVLGQLCGQVIPANPLFGLKYGQCARDEVTKALEMDPKLALAYVSRGVGNYYLPAQFGGGVDLALKDLDQAISLDPKLAEAYLWKGVALRKANRNAEAHKALETSLQLNPNRVWTKQQLEKTPAQ